jgi:ribosomal protein S13
MMEVTPMVLPIMTPEQRLDALAKATEARHARSALLARVKSGELTPGQVFERTDDAIMNKTRVQQVLRALPGYGPAKATALMTASGVDEKRRVGGLTDAQRARLLEAVSPSRADGRTPDRGSDRDEPTPAGQDLRQALQEQIGQVVRPVLDQLQNQLAEAVRQQIEQGLLLTRKEIEGEVDGALQPPPRQGRDWAEQALHQPQRGGPTEEGGRQPQAAERGIAEQADAAPRSAGIPGTAGAAVQEMVTRFVDALRGLLQAVGSWLRRILAALRERPAGLTWPG